MVGDKGSRVTVLMGGASSEREISMLSGKAVSSALIELEYKVTEVIVNDEALPGVSKISTDVVFIALHGGAGEDGEIQAHLENIGVSYTGSAPEASGLAMNKISAKRAFEDNGVPTPAYGKIDSHTPEDAIFAMAGDLGYPVVVKPVCEGSTLGITIVKVEDDLPEAVEAALAYGEGALLEVYVPGRELTVAILGEDPLPVVEICPAGEFYNFAAKYRDQGTECTTNMALPRHVLQEVSDAAIA